MSFASFLSQTCIIKREVPVGTDVYNNASTLPRQIGGTLQCRLTFKMMRIVDQVRGETSWVQVPLMLLPAGTDVQLHDMIYVDGAERGWKVAAPVLTRKAGNAAHHVSAVVEMVNG